jgi:hypothetical protein
MRGSHLLCQTDEGHDETGFLAANAAVNVSVDYVVFPMGMQVHFVLQT